jgi:hypothetical protein
VCVGTTILSEATRDASSRPRRVWKLPDLWTHRTRPQILAKPQNGFAQASTRLIVSPFQKNEDQTLSVCWDSDPQILRRRHNASLEVSPVALPRAQRPSPLQNRFVKDLASVHS